MATPARTSGEDSEEERRTLRKEVAEQYIQF